MADVPKPFRWPDTRSGKWAVYAILLFFLFMMIFYGLVMSGERGGETFFSNLLLAVPLLLAGVTGISSAFLSAWALLFSKDRKLVLVMSLTVGVFILFFTIAEIVGH